MQGIITAATEEAVIGITVMRNLAAYGRKDVRAEEAADFFALVDAVLYAIRRDSTAT